ncbi:MAG TPA: ABC transporter permease [Kiloniellales bacterium]|nr:ABC transporter permease [Kiloniellales bacterium]
MRVDRINRWNPRGLWTLFQRAVVRHVLRWIDSLAGPSTTMLLYLAVLVLARGSDSHEVWPGVDLVSFVAAGLVIHAACISAFESTAGYMLWERMEGIIQDTLAAPFSAFELLIGWVLGAAACGLMTGMVVATVFLPFVDWPAFDLLRLLGFAVLGTLLFALIGVIVGLWARKWDHYAAAESFVLMPLGLLSGTFFLREEVPEAGAWILSGNPVFYIVDGFRSGLLGHSDGNSVVGSLLLVALVYGLAILAWRLVFRGWRLKP